MYMDDRSTSFPVFIEYDNPPIRGAEGESHSELHSANSGEITSGFRLGGSNAESSVEENGVERTLLTTEAQGDTSMDFPTVESRVKSFERWRSHAKKPRHLAKAGLYYKGVKDQTTCFACDVEIENWRPDDSAFTEHEQFSRDCPYTRQEEYKLYKMYHEGRKKMHEMGVNKTCLDRGISSYRERGEGLQTVQGFVDILLDLCPMTDV